MCVFFGFAFVFVFYKPAVTPGSGLRPTLSAVAFASVVASSRGSTLLALLVRWPGHADQRRIRTTPKTSGGEWVMCVGVCLCGKSSWKDGPDAVDGWRCWWGYVWCGWFSAVDACRLNSTAGIW